MAATVRRRVRRAKSTGGSKATSSSVHDSSQHPTDSTGSLLFRYTLYSKFSLKGQLKWRKTFRVSTSHKCYRDSHRANCLFNFVQRRPGSQGPRVTGANNPQRMSPHSRRWTPIGSHPEQSHLVTNVVADTLATPVWRPCLQESGPCAVQYTLYNQSP